MMEWIRLKDKIPDFNKEKLVIGCDYNEGMDEREMHICDAIIRDKKKNAALLVLNSLRPPIGGYKEAHWMPLPTDDSELWIPFNLETYPHDKELYDKEVIIRLYNGNKYTGFISGSIYEPSFNMFKFGSIESISHYMELPSYPPEIEKDKS